MKSITQALLTTLLLSCSLTGQANTLAQDITGLQHGWAKANYQLNDDAQIEAFEQLIMQAEQVTKNYANTADSWIWSGIIKSSFAGAKGGLGALSYAKASKKDLEKALSLNENALKGSALTSLGVLFHKVPGWPIGFGSDKKAEKLLIKALKINPDGIDPNYFYGEYLYDERDYKKARQYLLLAQQAKARPDRPLADEYRQKEIAKILAKLDKRLKK